MQISEILAAVDAHQKKTGATDRAISIGAGGSEDMVRNWRRRLAKGEGAQGVNDRSARSVMKFLGEGGLTENRRFSANGLQEAVQPWVPRREVDLEAILKFLCPKATHPSSFMLNSNVPEYYRRAGDVLVIDLKAQASPGDVIIASKIDSETGTAETIIGRLLPPYIAPPDSTRPPVLIDSTIAIMGPVLSYFGNPDA